MRLSIAAIVLAFVPASWALAITSTTTSYQNGDANAYAGTVDMRISMTTSRDGTSGASPTTQLLIDGYRADDPNTTTTNEFSPDEQGFVRFDNIFGNNAGQIPLGATILDATIRLRTGNASTSNSPGPWGVARLNQPFDA